MKIPVLAYIAMGSSFFSMVVGFYRWKKVDQPLRYFILFLSVTAIQIGVEYVLGRFSIPTQVLTDFYTAFEVTFLLFLFRMVISSNLKKKIFLVFIILDLLILVFSIIYKSEISQFNSVLLLSARLFLIISSMIVIHSLLTDTLNISKPIYEYYIFWIATGVLIYYSGSFIVLSLGNEIMKYGIDYFFAVWKINWILFIIANILFSRSFFALARWTN
jgi:hypothetical protein